MIPPQCGIDTIGARPMTLQLLITSMILWSVLNSLSYWRTGCRVLGKVLEELTRRLGKPLVKPNSAQESADIAPRRSPVRVRLAP
jgi:hypothetical protein